MKQKRGQQMKRMKIDFEKAKQLLEEKPNLTEEEYNKRFWDLWEETTEEIERWKKLIWHI